MSNFKTISACVIIMCNIYLLANGNVNFAEYIIISCIAIHVGTTPTKE